MNKTQFYEMFGGDLELVNPGDAEYGEHLILHPEERHIAEDLHKNGHTIFTVYEESYEGGDEYVEEGLDTSSHPYKVGYFALRK